MKSILVSFLTVSMGMVLGRLSGFFREIILANQYGAGVESNFIIILLTTPDFFVNLLVGGALSMALIPEFKGLSKDNARVLYNQILLLSGIIFSILAMIMSYNSRAVLGFISPGLLPKLSTSDIQYFSISLMSIPFTVMAGVVTAYLHYKNKFFIASLGTLIFNSIVISSFYFLLFYKDHNTFYIITIAILASALIRFYIFHRAGNEKLLIDFSFNLINRRLIARYVSCVFIGGFFFIIPVVLRSMASNFGGGEISYVSYSTKLVEFPLGVLITVFSIVLFPKLSALYSEGKKIQYSNETTNVFFIVVFLSLSSMIPLYTNSIHYVSMIFGNGDLLESEDVSIIAKYLEIYSLTIPLQGVNSFIIASLSAQKRTGMPLISSVICVVVFLLLSTFFSENIEHILYTLVVSFAASSIFLVFFAFKYQALSFKTLNYNSLLSYSVFLVLYRLASSVNLSNFHTISVDILGFMMCFTLAIFSLKFESKYKK